MTGCRPSAKLIVWRNCELVTLGMVTFPIPESLPVSRVRDSFRDDGTPNDSAYEKRAAEFLDEVLWFAEAIADRKAKEKSSS